MVSVDKRVSLSEAVACYVGDGQTIALEGFGHLVPMAAAHEVIRQRFTGLVLARMSCDLMVDQLLAGGCVSRIVSSFVGNSSAGSLHEVRRRVEKRDPKPLELEEYSHGGMIARYIAGAAKLPFYPIKSYTGSDLVALNPRIRQVADPFSGDDIHVVPPLRPDVSIVHAQRADRAGNIQAWGILGVQQEVAFAGDRVVVTVEEVVDDEVVRSDPNRTIVPSHAVDAIVECPLGAHPSSVQGYYDRDDVFLRNWSELARSSDAIQDWLDDYIYATNDHNELMELYGDRLRERLRVDEQLSAPVNYGIRQ